MTVDQLGQSRRGGGVGIRWLQGDEEFQRVANMSPETLVFFHLESVNFISDFQPSSRRPGYQ